MKFSSLIAAAATAGVVAGGVTRFPGDPIGIRDKIGEQLSHNGSELNSPWTGPARAEITSLPGWYEQLPSKMYNGWISAGTPPNKEGEMFFHYWFIESEGSPSSDPVVLWYNGGPGASSLFGLLVELGPLMLNDQSLVSEKARTSGIPDLIYNQYGWSRNANLLIVDNPPPIGFSYCNPAGPKAGGTSCGAWNDELVAAANYNFIQNWRNSFPEYMASKFFLTGESYAGVYVPTIADRLMEEPKDLNLVGFAVGDGCMGNKVLCGADDGLGVWYDIEFLHGHGQVSNELYRKIMSTCPEEELKRGPMSAECKKLVAMMNDEVGGYYGYNLYDDCTRDGPFDLLSKPKRKYWGPPGSNLAAAEFDGYPCPGNAMAMWLNRSEVRAALHTVPGANYFSGDNGVGFNYTVSYPDVRPIYKKAILNPNMRVLVYNGDTDPGINSFVTQDIYTTYLETEYVNKTESWRPWTVDGHSNVGGYVISYKGGFSFLTIRGSGHMVPEFKPKATATFFNAFIKGEDFPRYVGRK